MFYITWNLTFLISIFLSLPFYRLNFEEKKEPEKINYEQLGADFVAKFNQKSGLKYYYFHRKLEIKHTFDTILNDFQAKWYGIKLYTDKNYQQLIDTIDIHRQKLKDFFENSEDKESALDSVKDYFLKTFINELIPHWYETKWAMNGSTQIPKQGFVGCSYFVANTLYDMGFNFNRVGVAQSSSRNIARTFQMTEDVVLLKNYTGKEAVKYIKDNYEEGLYIVGLDYHAAFILYHKNEVFLIHSSRTRNRVTIEFALLSKSFISNHYYIGEITTNDNLIIKWLNKEYIPKIEVFEFGK